MTILRALAVGFLSLVASFVVVLGTYRLLEGAGIWVGVGGIYAGGLALGVVLGRAFGGKHLPAIGVGAFVAVGLLWTPVVLTTYGFALAAVPLLVVYSLLVVWGARLARRGRKSADVVA